LSNLRTPGTKERKIPYGYGFGLVSCPNYLFEAMAWGSIVLLTQSWAAMAFFVFSTVQMYIWAVKKHKNYKIEFSQYPKTRRAMIPFLF
jgi:very-long-chain enoyl-CoA reductase